EEDDGDDPIRVDQVARLEAIEFMVQNKEFKEIDRAKEKRLKPSIEDPPNLELKTLSKHLEYAFLKKDSKLSIIISSKLKVD
ncbi:unnamed protein product, partial [Dovyalis caffra]